MRMHPGLDGSKASLRKILLWATVALCLMAGGHAQQARAQGQTAQPPVYCHDQARDSVRVTQAGQCPGRVISAAEAERIRAERDARTRRIIGDRPPDQGGVNAPRGMRRGSGFFITADGLLLTNRHVINQCRTISVTTEDGRTVDARLQGAAEADDIALLATTGARAAFARFSSTPDATSDALVVVGYPQGSPTPSVATLSSASRGIVDLRARQHFYAIPGVVYPGHSGSPVLDQAGHVVGMVAARITARRTLPGANQQQSFVGAVPISTIAAFLALNGVRYETAPASEEWTDRELLSQARRFVARVNCTL
jgi:S1-C subfamily serine protease